MREKKAPRCFATDIDTNSQSKNVQIHVDVGEKYCRSFFSKKQGFRNWDLSQPEVDEMVCKKNYRMHCADFMRNCPVEKRLVLERLDCGWEVVCDFVGKDVPDVQGGFEETSVNQRS